ACAGRSLARRQHQSERRLHGMFHGRGGAGGRQGPARVPPRAHEPASQTPRRAQRRGGEGDWGKPLPPGVHRGIAQFMGYGSYSAAVAEVSVSDRGQLKVHRMVLALDCGHAVNPGQIAAQVEGSVAYGLTATLYGECKVKDGRMVDLNFDSYQIMRLAEMPKVETVIVPSHDFWGGVGEPTISVVAPAVLNAIHAATGKPVRQLPLKNVRLV